MRVSLRKASSRASGGRLGFRRASASRRRRSKTTRRSRGRLARLPAARGNLGAVEDFVAEPGEPVEGGLLDNGLGEACAVTTRLDQWRVMRPPPRRHVRRPGPEVARNEPGQQGVPDWPKCARLTFGGGQSVEQRVCEYHQRLSRTSAGGQHDSRSFGDGRMRPHREGTRAPSSEMCKATRCSSGDVAAR